MTLEEHLEHCRELRERRDAKQAIADAKFWGKIETELAFERPDSKQKVAVEKMADPAPIHRPPQPRKYIDMFEMTFLSLEESAKPDRRLLVPSDR